jgi:hypothetical protein
LKQMQEAANVQSASPGQSARAMIEEADAVDADQGQDAAKGCRRKQRARRCRSFPRIVQVHEKHE